MTARRGRSFSPLLVVLLLALPASIVTFGFPALVPTETWYALTIDITLISLFVVWWLFILIGKSARRIQAQPNIRRLLSDDYLLHWQYNVEEWERFAAHEYRRDRCLSRSFTSLREGVIGSVLFGSLVTAVLLLINSSEASKPGGHAPYPPQALALTLPIAFGLPLLVTVLQILNLYLGDQRMHQQRRRLPEIYLNDKGIYGLPGGYLALPPKNTKISLETGDLPILLISMTTMTSSKAGRHPRTVIERLLIPHGHEAEAQQFAASRLSAL